MDICKSISVGYTLIIKWMLYYMSLYVNRKANGKKKEEIENN